MIYPANLNLAISSVAQTFSSQTLARKESVAKLASGSNFEATRADLGGVKVAMKFKSSGIMLDAMHSNMTSALSYLTAQEDSLKQLGTQLDRMSELVTAMSDTTKTSHEQNSYLEEFNQLRSALAAGRAEKFNGLSLSYYEGEKPSYSVQLSADNASTLDILPADMSRQAGWVAVLGYNEPYTGISGVSDTPANLMDPNLLGGISFFEGLSGTVSSLLATNASQQSQLRFALDHTKGAASLTKNAANTISDVDVAREVTKLTKTDILLNSGSAMFAQANLAAESVLKLYGV